LLEELGVTFPRTHELDLLRTLLLPHHRSFHGWRRGLVFLTSFAVAVRYPGYDATKRQATAALRWAARVREACRQILGLPKA